MESRHIFDYLNGISEAGARAASTISNMLSFSRKNTTEWTNENLNNLIDETIDIASKDYDLKKGYDFRKTAIIKNYQEDLPSASCVRSEIQQVILNLLSNASQAMSAAKKTTPSPEVNITTTSNDTGITITIRDNGPGIHEKKLQYIFEPFFTTKAKGEGTGLGLSVSQYIISERHHGSITAENNPGGGSCFAIRLPFGNNGPEKE